MFLFVKTIDFLVGMWYGYLWEITTQMLRPGRLRQAEKWIDKAYLKLKTSIVGRLYLIYV